MGRTIEQRDEAFRRVIARRVILERHEPELARLLGVSKPARVWGPHGEVPPGMDHDGAGDRVGGRVIDRLEVVAEPVRRLDLRHRDDDLLRGPTRAGRDGKLVPGRFAAAVDFTALSWTSTIRTPPKGFSRWAELASFSASRTPR